MEKDSTYRSERLTYTGLSREDAEDVVRWRSDPNNYRFFFNAAPITLEGHLAWFGRYLLDTTRYDFVIHDESGRAIGTVGLSNIDADSCEVNYMIGEIEARGKGYAKEAVRAFSRIALDELGVSSVCARIVTGNEASAAVVEGVGFTEIERVYRLQATNEE